MSKSEKPAEAAAAKPSLMARLRAVRNLPQWVRQHQIKAAVAFSVGFSIIGASLFTWALLEAQRLQADKERNYTTADALHALDEGNLPEALHIAKLVQQHNNVTIEDAGGPAYLFGVAALQRAENQYDINRHHAYKIAAYWFDEAFRRGVPEERRAEGLYLCGKSTVLAERYSDAIPVLTEALPLVPDRASELYGYLALAYFLEPDPDLPEAMAAIDRRLADKDLSHDDRIDSLLLRAEILLRLDRPADAGRDLAEIPADSKRQVDALILRARQLLAEASPPRDAPIGDAALSPEAKDRIAQAMKLLAEAMERDQGLTSATPRSLYVAGLAELQLGKLDEAAEQFHQAYRRGVDTPEGLAAQVQSAKLARRRDRYETAVSLYREAIDDVGVVRWYHNRWMSMSELKRQLVEAYEDLFAHREYPSAAALADLFPKLFDEDYAVQLAAEANAAWGKQLAETPPSAEHDHEELAESSRKYYRIAARLYDRLALLRQATKLYPDEIWSSARCYLLGTDYTDAARQYRRYLEVEPHGRHAEALVGLAEVLLVRERHDQAMALLQQCIDIHPRDPAVYRARLLQAQLYAELNQLDPAVKALSANLEAEALTPVSQEWRRSLFALGRMLYDAGRYSDAVERLEEAIERYPDDQEATDARYRAAESHRRTAQHIEGEIPVDALPAERAKFVHRADEEYQAALTRFDETIRTARSPNHQELSESSRVAMLRNSLFARGSILHALGKYDEAVRAHQTAVASFPNSPAALDAYLQIVDCYRRMHRAAEARGTLEQARLMLNRLPQDASFEAVSNYSRTEWAKLLDTLGAL